MSEESRTRPLIEEELDLELIDVDLYRSKRLWRPSRARGVFGGQVVGQALGAATRTLDPKFHVHSLHAYFLLPGDSRIPIIYVVDRIRDGKSFATRSVAAKQRGRVIFQALVSFQVPEKSILSHQIPMPQVPEPEMVPSQEDNMRKLLEDPKAAKLHKMVRMRLDEPLPIEYRDIVGGETYEPVVSRNTGSGQSKGGAKRMLWMKSKGRLPDDMSYHHCAVAYCSDHYLLGTAMLQHNVSFSESSNPRLTIVASLDHTLWFHDVFRADDYLLYIMESSWTGGGRAMMYGRIYTRDGRLVVSCAQEGLLRAEYNVPKALKDSTPVDPASSKPKL
ncbi:hypothetical protein SmJEL517_g03530 [Synchytrium microbalum]|uniref:Acyl-CoA thioesterase II n=1 Tax=Synchytrium microbalum TaxID=1806994 RepID=A0A507C818_9FUNG|nr:uncharacterized protein SmJEL517_g03530 [Synchytrium microbalum]TPX33645.1 hypothetical protein SmJEL517_g03530 [Synchytrium microbalum]